jgi:hypothetical protein
VASAELGVKKMNAKSDLVRFKHQVSKTQAAMDRADRAALIEHAKLGYSVPEWDGTRVIHITPLEIFARYGLDESGREKPVETNE